jgi:hypothetical protein
MRALFAALLLTTAAAPAAAQDIGWADRYFQGVWAFDCAAPPGPGNILASFFHTPGSPKLWLLAVGKAGDTASQSVTEVLIDKVNPDRTATVRYDHGGGHVNSTEVDLSDPAAYTILSSVNQKGETNGKPGQPRKPYHRCSALTLRQ